MTTKQQIKLLRGMGLAPALKEVRKTIQREDIDTSSVDLQAISQEDIIQAVLDAPSKELINLMCVDAIYNTRQPIKGSYKSIINYGLPIALMSTGDALFKRLYLLYFSQYDWFIPTYVPLSDLIGISLTINN